MQTIDEIHRERLLLLIDEYDGVGRLAEKLGKSPAQVSQWKNASPDSKTGKPRTMSDDTAREIEHKCGKPKGWMDQPVARQARAPYHATPVEVDERSDYATVKRVRFKLSAGVSGYEVEYLNGSRAPIFFRRDWLSARNLNPDKLMAVEVMGQSMETSLYEGDVVVVNVADTTPKDGEAFAVNYDGEMVIKRLMKDAGEWFLSSDNQDKRRFPNKRCDERTTIIGRIVHKQSERI